MPVADEAWTPSALIGLSRSSNFEIKNAHPIPRLAMVGSAVTSSHHHSLLRARLTHAQNAEHTRCTYTFYFLSLLNNYERAFYSTNFEKQKAKSQKQGQTSFQK